MRLNANSAIAIIVTMSLAAAADAQVEPDCNGNGIADRCDIANGTSEDINGNGIPDECDECLNDGMCGEGGLCEDGVCVDPCADTDGDGQVTICHVPPGNPHNAHTITVSVNDVPDHLAHGDQCGLCGGASDCDNNGIADECDLDCGEPGGGCDVEGCGLASDCNGNGTPDVCELERNDCDLNEVPDDCDIAGCTPESPGFPACDDCNLNGVPDGCDIDPLDPDGNCHTSDDIDLDGVPDECVGAQSDGDWSADIWGLEGDNPYPDNEEGVPDLAVTLNGVSLFLDVDAEILALRLINDATLDVTQSEVGDLTIADPGGVFDGNLLIEGTLNIGNGRLIDTSGTVTIGAGGVYKSLLPFGGQTSGDLMAGDIVVDCGGSLKLEGTMSLGTGGNLTMQSSEEDDKGDCTPPDFEGGDDSTTAVSGDFEILGPASVDYSSTQPLLLGGDFDNRSTDAEIFDWSAGGMVLNGPLHTIEAAGENRGPWPAGLQDNFAIGTFTLAPETSVQVIDEFDNQQDGVTACDEALYVDSLIVSAGAVLLTDGCLVYYNELTNEGSVPGLGIDVLQILEPCPGDFDGDGDIGASDLAVLLGSWGGCEVCTADLDDDGDVDATDLAILLGSWGQCN